MRKYNSKRTVSHSDILSMLEETGLPAAYDHFAEGESPAPPFLVFLYPSSDNFAADGSVYKKINVLHVELYTDLKRPDVEENIESIFDKYGLYYEKSEVWISDERLYEILYTMEILCRDD